ncbi:hypothetical protein JQ634_10205 [Bradyrhizobium sp. AUGA SZCCT0240]|jgi:hypothetical protein|uniref:hypothetical protein n=1 Tax=unclassified Bradyrhizobium TaxID=2631580 RepID=UPI001BA7F5BB|nr:MULTISPECIES: hypothetical protein [unclassified Bradyrhizobium]MBR1191724.1 hypothetical protein [Bradyrhizobium sp. AUGA SZCCT0160]MBR1197165.1 hypothetical protein [Bradyrhizobium sp. AUGA SZCCT0158]MBR1240030.1 hypothetical protein [Bradyrhizobium sp. AUGA SZCCT0274]MBR1254074.1 hypothetical protein [Bradyrhizobium sp. AUGA SZCCT0240]
MKDFSIVRIGNEYVVQAGEKSVLKTSSRRMAARLINDAAGLLEQQPVSSTAVDASITCDVRDISEAPEVP